jgi:hypothetical protein
MPFAQAVQIMRDGRATHFDPRLLDIFLDVVVDGRAAGAPPGPHPAGALCRTGGPKLPPLT